MSRYAQHDTMCLVDGCRNMHHEKHPMCEECWLGLPSYVRSEVNRARGTTAAAGAIAQALASAADRKRGEA